METGTTQLARNLLDSGVRETTQPNSVGEVTVAIPLISTAVATLGLHPESISGDAEYDAESILGCIFHDLGAKPFIPCDPRSLQDKSGFRRDGHRVYCPAHLPMHRHGRMTVKGITYLQSRCPLHFGPPQELLLRPANHAKFSQQKGCNYLWRCQLGHPEKICFISTFVPDFLSTPPRSFDPKK